jgi:hypothetical protein
MLQTRIVIENIKPQLDSGAFFYKACCRAGRNGNCRCFLGRA